MNHVYRLTWNESLQQYVPVPETAGGRHKAGGRTKRKLMAAAVTAAMMGGAAGVSALPVGGQITSGTGGVTQKLTTLTVNQSSQNLTLNWQSFNIAGNEAVNFIQPNASAIALNRVLGSDPSAIYGKLNANGQVFLLNPNGMLFGKSAEVNVGGLVASTLNLSDADFIAGKRTFGSAGSDGVAISNLGQIIANGGYIAFLGGKVSNQGTLQANLGTVALAAGNQTTLDFAGDKLIGVQVEVGALQSLAENGQLIQADGGTVILTAKAAGSLVAGVVNNTGLIQARTLENHAGVISLLGDMQSGMVNVGGALDASAPNGGDGGFVETSAAAVKVAADAKITTAASMGLAGTWLVDPVDFTIAASGGDISGATLSTNLGAGNVSILSSAGASGAAGNVNVNDAVTWSSNQLTLNAQNNININANLNGSGTASLALQYGQGTVNAGNTSSYILSNGAQVNLPAGQNFSTKLGSDGTTSSYTVINSLGAAGNTTTTDLQGINGNLAGNYVLGANIDASATSTWNSGAGFTPIGNSSTPITGVFDGLGHTIGNLTINYSPTAFFDGLFGFAGMGSVIRNVGLVGESVSGMSNVGGLVGYNNGTVSNSYATGSVRGFGANVGGLVGGNGGTISNAFATGSVGGSENVGGLVGGNDGTVSNAYAMGSVNGNDNIGGLVGSNYGKVSNAYATGNVSGNVNGVGGLVGANGGTISNAYATGSVSGIVGFEFGGFVGYNVGGTVSNSFWNTTTSGQKKSAGGTGLTSTQMMQLSSFSGWNISAIGGSGDVWRIYQGHAAPLLTGFLSPLTLTDSPDVTVTYNGSSHAGGGSTSINGVLGSAAPGGANAGVYNGYYSTQQGYDITGGNLIIDQAILTVSGITVSNKVYNGTEAATLTGKGTLSGVFGSDKVTLTNTGTFASKNVGANIAVTATLKGASAGNYTTTGLVANITPKTLAVTAKGGGMVYDGLTTDTGTITLAATGVIKGDLVSFTDTSATLANKNVGTEAVTVSGITASGTDAGNYTVNTTASTTAIVTAKPITLTATSGNMVYSGSTTDTAAIAITSTGVIAGDVVNFTDTSVAFADKNAGTGKTVTVSGIKDSGADAKNYALTSTTATTTANITPLAVTVVATSGNMVYDGSTIDTATVTLAGKGVVKGDVVILTDSSTSFADKNVGIGKVVTVSGIAASGADAGNYTFSTTATAKAKANITVKTITVTATSGNMAYDGSATDTAAITLASTGVIAGDVVNFSDTSAKFANSAVGVGKTITVSGITDSGADAGNYTLGSTTARTTANITP